MNPKIYLYSARINSISENGLAEKLNLLHQNEDLWNKEMSDIDKEIKRLQKRKNKLKIMVSKNMKYRNVLLKKL